MWSPSKSRSKSASSSFSAASECYFGWTVYVDSLAGGADLEKLKRNWLSSPLIKQISTMNDVAFVKREIAESVRRDFSEGRSVNVKGWVLSETEAFLCALVYFDSLNP